MRLAIDEFIRRFLIHVLPAGFHRIRHYGLFASGARAQNIARARELLAAATPREQDIRANDGDEAEPRASHPCPCCGSRMIVRDAERSRANARRSQDRRRGRDRVTQAAKQRSAVVVASGLCSKQIRKPLANTAAAPNHISMSAEDAPSLHAIHPNHLRSSLRPRLN
jgi:hypothetical protein